MGGVVERKGFLDLPTELEDPANSRIEIIPVPYDLTTTWKRGASGGPEAIIEASSALEWYDIETASEVCRVGIVTGEAIVHHEGPEELADLVAARVGASIESGRLPVVLGGEHSVTIGAVRECARRRPGMSVLQIDAHGDTRESYEGSTHNHACVMARAREDCPIVQVGIRSIAEEESFAIDKDRVFYAHDICRAPDQTWISRVVDLLTDDVYVTIDVDAFDPSIMPATGTPEPGGMTWYQVDSLVREVARNRNVVGFDVVELAPEDGLHGCAFTCAKLVYRFLSEIGASGRWTD